MPHFASISRAIPLALLIAAPLVAQTPEPPRVGTISGSVRDARSSAPIADASVTLEGAALAALSAPASSALLRQTRATRTDTSGAYTFGGVATGEYRLHVQRSGYQPATVPVALRSAAVRVEPLALRPGRVSRAEERRRDLPRSIGVGYGGVSSGHVDGSGWHAQAAAAIARAPGAGRPRAEVWAMGQQGSGTGSPLSCEQVSTTYCFGRTDRTTLVGIGLGLALERSILGVTAYGRTGSGLYHQRVRSREVEGPTTTCVEGTTIFSCPENPPFASYTRTSNRAGAGLHSAIGVHLNVGGVRGFIETGVHAARVGNDFAGSIPFTFGITL